MPFVVGITRGTFVVKVDISYHVSISRLEEYMEAQQPYLPGMEVRLVWLRRFGAWLRGIVSACLQVRHDHPEPEVLAEEVRQLPFVEF